jgi:protein required for attachment to host cells
VRELEVFMNNQIPPNALVMVGDGSRALFLRNRGTRADVDLVMEREIKQDNPPTREQGTDRPGRLFGSDGVSRSSVGETDFHQLAEQKFAERIADDLYRMGHAQEFAALVVVAPPRMLGDLRARLHPEVTQRIVAEISKDLAGHPLPEITRLLS